MKVSVIGRPNGVGLLDLMVALVIFSLFAALAVPAYTGMVNRGRVAGAIGDVGSIAVQIERFAVNNNDRLPANLNELQMDIPKDPWGNDYQYLNIRAAGPGNGPFRKDGNLNPINTDFDLYSMGADGASAGPLSAKNSRDDIVRANNGAFIGLGEDY
ncbi:MAG: prepilin-type cleavage/methylation domain-containing protein [Gammaproteobacteria bacterium]|nr:prepilin-type cleavage/methylation domain-containing protein [Gammaproteobacteria bacterium]